MTSGTSGWAFTDQHLLSDRPPGATRDQTPPGVRWYALHVRSRSEKLTAAALRNRGYEEFLPLYRSRRRWSDRAKEVELPLFSGYVFCRFEALYRLAILLAPGVIEIVSAGRIPAPVDEEEIAALRTVTASGLAAEPWPYLQTGSIVRVEHGALAGLEGILLEIRKRQRLVLSVTLLQRSVAVEIDRDWVSPVWSASNRRRGDHVALAAGMRSRDQ